MASEAGLRFEPNRLERWRADTCWECRSEEVIELRVSGKIWLVIETTAAVETFRIFGAASVARNLLAALRPAAATQV